MVRIFIDDIDGSPAAETKTFAVDGIEYEIELSDLNAKKFAEALAVFVEHARLTGENGQVPGTMPAATASTPPRAVAKAVRQARKSAAKKTAPKRGARKAAPVRKQAPPLAPFVPDQTALRGGPASPAFTEPAEPAEPVTEVIDGLDLDPEPEHDVTAPVFSPDEEATGEEETADQPVQVSLKNDELSESQRKEIRRWMARHTDPVYRAKASARGRLAQSIIDAYFQANPITVRLDFDTDD